MDLGLKGKLAVITGGSVGIGLAVAEGFAAEAAQVLITARGKERVEAEAARIAAKYGVTARGVRVRREPRGPRRRRTPRVQRGALTRIVCSEPGVVARGGYGCRPDGPSES